MRAVVVSKTILEQCPKALSASKKQAVKFHRQQEFFSSSERISSILLIVTVFSATTSFLDAAICSRARSNIGRGGGMLEKKRSYVWVGPKALPNVACVCPLLIRKSPISRTKHNTTNTNITNPTISCITDTYIHIHEILCVSSGVDVWQFLMLSVC